MNRLVLGARIVERSSLRWTPAGLPALDLKLEHESVQTEAGHPRKVLMRMPAVVIGDGLAQQVAAVALGEAVQMAGFMAAGRNGRGLVFHVTTVDVVPVPEAPGPAPAGLQDNP